MSASNFVFFELAADCQLVTGDCKGEDMAYENIIFDRDGAVATIMVSREKVLNALNDATTAEIYQALREVEEDDGLRVAIITGKGEKAFIAGADINELRASPSATAARTMSQTSHEVGLYIARMTKIVIAAINGFALGGGCELAMMCDIRLAADTARLGVTWFCWGGWASWMFAVHQPALKAAVSWYGSDRRPRPEARWSSSSRCP